MENTTVWEELGRKEGELRLGDTFMTKSNQLRTIVLNISKCKNFSPAISMDEAKQLLQDGEIMGISDREGVLYNF